MAAPTLTPTCLWLATPEVVIALDGTFGEPIDSYVNGSHVWLREDGPGGMMIEWRLHPVPGYRRPDGLDVYEVFSAVALALATGGDPTIAPEQLWEGLEAFPAYGDEIEPAPLAAVVTEALGLAPDASGLVDHGPIADRWERTGGRVSIVADLLAQLRPPS